MSRACLAWPNAPRFFWTGRLINLTWPALSPTLCRCACDQANVQERSSQVQRMRDIYSYAKRTTVWLGDGTGDGDSAMASIADIANYGFFDRGKRAGLAVLRTSRYNFPELLKFHGRHSEKLKAVKDLLSRPWFCRMWVVQELFVSEEIIVVCGTSYITWETLSCALAALVHCTEMSESAMIWGQPLRLHSKDGSLSKEERNLATWRRNRNHQWIDA